MRMLFLAHLLSQPELGLGSPRPVDPRVSLSLGGRTRSSVSRAGYRHLTDVVTGGFAKFLISGDKVEDVIDNLKGHSVCVAKLRQPINDIPLSAANDSADPT